MEEVVKLINQTGFPIAAFLLMFWLNVKVIKQNTDAIQNINTMLTKMGDVLNQLVSKIEPSSLHDERSTDKTH